MSIEKVKKILDRAYNDQKFRELLISNPDETLKEYDLDEETLKHFRNVKAEKLTAFKNNLDNRLSKDGSAGLSGDWWVESVTD